MSNTQLRLAPGVKVQLMYGDFEVDCRLLFIGDRYRQLIRAYEEAIYRLSRPWPLPELDRYLRASAEVAQMYEVTSTDAKIAIRMRDHIFATQASLSEIDLSLVARPGRSPGSPLRGRRPR